MSTAPYRSLALVVPMTPERAPLRTVTAACPACGVSFRTQAICEAGHKTSRKYDRVCDRLSCNANYSLQLGAGAALYCGPNKRRRFGFLWLRRCQEPGTHVHQECKRCGWSDLQAPELPGTGEEA